jgi:hypothetical protein
MLKELSDHEAADLWRQLSQLVDEGRKLTFEHTVSGRTGELTGVIQCHLFPLAVERHLLHRSGVKRWVRAQRGELTTG